MLKQLTKAVIEAALKAEMNQHLGHARHGAVANPSGNVRNGQSGKTLTGDFGEIQIAVPRDRDASFTPQLIPKHQRRVPGFDERILSLYARGMSTREIAAQLQEMFGAEVSPALILAITDTVAADLRAIYTAATADEAAAALEAFALKWDGTYPRIAKSWRNHWAHVIPFFAYAPEIRRVIYTTNAIESVNYSLRRLTKTRGSFPNDEAAIKLLYLGLRNISQRWTMPIQNWKHAMSQLMIRFEAQFNNA